MGLSLGFGATGVESGTVVWVVTVKAEADSSAEVIEVVSSVEVTVAVLLVPSNEDDDNNPSIVEGDKGEGIININ